MKYVTHKETGKRYCLDCKRYDCICLPEPDEYFDGKNCTELQVKDVISISKKADKLIFYKQKLPNGRVIPSNSELIVPLGKWVTERYRPRHIISLSNDIINKSFW